MKETKDNAQLKVQNSEVNLLDDKKNRKNTLSKQESKKEVAIIINVNKRVKPVRHGSDIQFVDRVRLYSMKSKGKKSLVSSVYGIKLVSALSYLCFFLPLIFCRHEPYAIFHANQSLILWMTVSILYVALWLLSVNAIFLLIVMIFHILGLFFGMYNATHNRARSFFGTDKLYVFRA